MTNPFDLAYLATATSVLGPFAWIFFILQLAGVGAGVYLMYFRQDDNRVRRDLLRQLGIALLIMGGIGVALALLRLGNVPVFNQRYWFYIQLLVELGLGGYLFYYMRNVYPTLLARSVATRGKSGSRRPAPRAISSQTGQNGSAGAPQAPRPVATTSRRDARRDRKRKSR